MTRALLSLGAALVLPLALAGYQPPDGAWTELADTVTGDAGEAGTVMA